jgi:hypothetical protein
VTAVFSDCGKYRYRLERCLDVGILAAPGLRTMSVTMLNPSTADADANDPTIRKLLGFGKRVGVGRLIVTNLGALVSTDPRGLLKANDPVGPENDRHILEAVAEADIVVAAWGANAVLFRGAVAGRRRAVVAMLRASGREVMCWGQTVTGLPRHPLMLPYVTDLEPYMPLLDEVCAPKDVP